MQRIAIYRTGTKYPPANYDGSVSPGTAVNVTARRNGQPVVERRVLKPTTVI